MTKQYEVYVILATGLFLGIMVCYYWFKLKNALKRRKRKLKKYGGKMPPAVNRFYKEITIEGIPFPVADPQPMDGYTREIFGPPISQKLPNEKYSPRDKALLHFGTKVTSFGNKITSGLWRCPYSGSVLTQPGEVEIDHIVPLAEAWRSGALLWSPKKRLQFGRSGDNLIAVSKVANRAKGDSDITKWLPNMSAPEYIVLYLQVKKKYGLSLNRQEAALVKKYFKQ